MLHTVLEWYGATKFIARLFINITMLKDVCKRVSFVGICKTSGKMVLSLVNRSLSATILLQITSGKQKWVQNG